MSSPLHLSTLPLATIEFADLSWLWPIVAFLTLALLLVLHSYWRSPLPTPARLAAAGLKTLGFVLLALALLQPVKVTTTPKSQANDLVLLTDNTASMTLSTPASPASPADMAREALSLPPSDGAAPAPPPAWLQSLQDTYRLHRYHFDEALHPTEATAAPDFTSQGSALGAALESLDRRFEHRPHAATVLVSDGNLTDEPKLREWLQSIQDKEHPTPIFPLLPETPATGFRDLSLLRVETTNSPFEDARVSLTVTIGVHGSYRHPATIEVKNAAGESLHTEEAPLPEGPGFSTRTRQVRLPAVPEGISFLEVSVTPHADDSTPAEQTSSNNTRWVSVDQGQGPYRILYVGGRPNWDYKFLRRSLADDAQLDMAALVRIAKREPKFEWRGRGESSNPLFRGFQNEVIRETQRYDDPVMLRLNTADAQELLSGFPSLAEDLFPHFHAIILDDIEAEFFTQDQLLLIEQFVAHRGGTLLMLGGRESFRDGHWEDTPVARVLPVYLDDVANGVAPADAAFSLAREGWLEPWLRLHPSQEDDHIRVAHMSRFFAINQIKSIKPGAALLATVTDSEMREWPAVVSHRYGSGKSVALTLGDVWRWGLQSPEQQQEMAKVWRQLARWMVVDVPERVAMELRHLDDGGLPLTQVAVRVTDQRFVPQDDATVRLTITDRDGTTHHLTAEPSLEEPGKFTAEHLTRHSRGYRIDAEVTGGDGETIGRARGAQAFNAETDEFAQIGVQEAILREIAESSGGQVLRPSQLDRLPDMLSHISSPIEERSIQPLWHSPLIFLLALSCFLGEWGIRRRYGVL